MSEETSNNGHRPASVLAQVRTHMQISGGREVTTAEVLDLGMSRAASYGALSTLTKLGEISRLRPGVYVNGGKKKKKEPTAPPQERDPEAAGLAREYRRKSSIDKRLAEMIEIGFPDGVKPEKISTFLQWCDMTRSLIG